ncbi:MAG: NUDIX hydrolase [Brevinema sp.]
MIRPFTASDLAHFSGISVLTYAKKGGVAKDYLLFKRRDFISCLVIIDDHLALLVKQFRPIINSDTIEIPMGKLEENETPIEALHRELLEECGLSLSNLTLTVKDKNNHAHPISFKSHVLTELGFVYPSPGFSDVKNFRFILKLFTHQGNIEELLKNYQLFSEESDLSIFSLPIHDISAWENVSGISKLSLYEYLISCDTK